MEARVAKLAVQMIERPLRKWAKQAGMPYERFMRMVIEMSRTIGSRKDIARAQAIEALLSGKLEQALEKARLPARKASELFGELDNLEGTVRTILLDLSKKLRPRSGGNPKSLPPSKTLEVLQEFERLTKTKSNRKAYQEIVKHLHDEGLDVSPQTIRRICDPKEASRSGCNYLGTEKARAYMAAIRNDAACEPGQTRPARSAKP